MAVKRRGLGRGLEALLGDADPVSVTNEKAVEQLKNLPLDKIKRGQYQPRVHFEEESLQELADSIRSQGILQPIVVRPIGDEYELIAGERRWRAAQLAELQEIPAVIREGLPDEAVAAVALIENIQREDLNPLEEARAFKRLIEEFDMTHEQVAQIVGRSRTGVTNLLRLLDLNKEVQKMLEGRKIDMGHARAMLSLNPGQQLSIAHTIIGKGLSVRETERLVKLTLREKPNTKVKPSKDADITRLERSLSDQLAAKVAIQHNSSGKGKLIIHYSSTDELEGILKRIR